MTGAPDETDAAFEDDELFLDRVWGQWITFVAKHGSLPLKPLEMHRFWHLASAGVSRAHAAPRTVQAGVTDEQVEGILSLKQAREWCEADIDFAKNKLLVAAFFAHMRRSVPVYLDRIAALEAAASVPTVAPTRKAYAKGDWWVVGKGWTSADHITKPDLMPLSVVLQTSEPTAPAACSCGGLAWQPIETAPKNGRKVWLAVKGRDTAIKAHWCTSFGEGPNGWFDGGRIHAKLVYAWHDVETPPQLPAFPSTQDTPCACYRAGLERAAEIAEKKAKVLVHRVNCESEF